MKLIAPALTMVVACTGLTGGDDPVAIELVNPPDSIQVGDTTPVQVRVLNRAGDSLPGAGWILVGLDSAWVPSGADSVRRAIIGVDATGHAVIGEVAGSGRIIATTGELPTEPFRIVVYQP